MKHVGRVLSVNAHLPDLFRSLRNTQHQQCDEKKEKKPQKRTMMKKNKGTTHGGIGIRKVSVLYILKKN